MELVNTIDGRRARGDVSRRAVMDVAVTVASVRGLEGLSIGELASAASMSKGGIAGLFGTKEQLQLATVAAAAEIFTATVIVPALKQPSGIVRLRALIENWLAYSENRVFAGGCFFAAATAEYRARPGVVRDAVARQMVQWDEFIRGAIDRAVANGELASDTPVAQLAFELTSLLDGANSTSLLFDSIEPYAKARVAVARLLS